MNIKVVAFTVSENSSNIVVCTKEFINGFHLCKPMILRPHWFMKRHGHPFRALMCIYRGSYTCMSAGVLLNLLNELRKRDKMQTRGLPSFLSLYCNESYQFDNAEHYALNQSYK